jgi:hypothetical protein
MNKVTIKDGALVGQDFSFFDWHGGDIEFTAVQFTKEHCKLTAPGYGIPGDYGNGAIFVNNKDVVPAVKKRKRKIMTRKEFEKDLDFLWRNVYNGIVYDRLLEHDAQQREMIEKLTSDFAEVSLTYALETFGYFRDKYGDDCEEVQRLRALLLQIENKLTSSKIPTWVQDNIE